MSTVIGNGIIGALGENLSTKTITSNGTYLASDDNISGYSSVTVNVPSTFSGGGATKKIFHDQPCALLLNFVLFNNIVYKSFTNKNSEV